MEAGGQLCAFIVGTELQLERDEKVLEIVVVIVIHNENELNATKLY